MLNYKITYKNTNSLLLDSVETNESKSAVLIRISMGSPVFKTFTSTCEDVTN